MQRGGRPLARAGGGACCVSSWRALCPSARLLIRALRRAGYAAQVLPRQDWCDLERHQARCGRRDLQAGMPYAPPRFRRPAQPVAALLPCCRFRLSPEPVTRVWEPVGHVQLEHRAAPESCHGSRSGASPLRQRAALPGALLAVRQPWVWAGCLHAGENSLKPHPVSPCALSTSQDASRESGWPSPRRVPGDSAVLHPAWRSVPPRDAAHVLALRDVAGT